MTTEAGPPEADHTARLHFRGWRMLLNAGAFVAAFSVLCSVVHMPVPLGEIPGSGYKYGYFAQHKDEYDLIFIGSSRVFHHFIPQQFDQKLEEDTGRRINSFNFGYDAMWPPESYYMLREALRLRPKRLRWVLIDLMQINPKVELENASTLRTAYWHDLEHTILALRALRVERMSRWDKVDTAFGHLEQLLSQWVDRGRGSDWLEKRLRPPDRKKRSPRAWEPVEGYEAGGTGIMAGAELKKFNNLLAKYRSSSPPAAARPELIEAAQRVIRMVRDAGAEPIFVLAPTIDQKENVVAHFSDVTVFSFADPDEYQALYDPVNHYDSWHLNQNGAEAFTDLLAERFAIHLQGRGVSAPATP